MPLTKLQVRPGVNQENTRYAGQGQWWECDKVRFRAGTPEKIGGWTRISADTFLGVCRSLLPWVTLGGAQLVGVGTNLKFYLENGGQYFDITPLRATATLTDPFTATDGSHLLLVADTAHGASDGDFVTFSGATGLGGDVTAGVLNQEYQVTVVDADSYTVTLPVPAVAADAAGSPGGGTVTADYQIAVGEAIQVPTEGWGVGAWGLGVWGIGSTDWAQMRTWSQSNFGEDLLLAPRGGVIYRWDASASAALETRAVAISTLAGASDTPTAVNAILVSDVSRFVMAFGVNELGSTTLDPMLVRWSDQENAVDWTPLATNQAGGIRLSIGSEIIAVTPLRQEILVWTDSALYSMQYQGAPIVWGAQLMGSSSSIVGPKCVATADGVAYWMGGGKFYKYDGRVQTLRCDLRQYIFRDFNADQQLQVFAGTVEEFTEVWWFYPSAGSLVPNKYVVYNYAEDIWYMGGLTRYAWVDRGLREYPLAAGENQLLDQEFECCDLSGDAPLPIPSYIESTEFDVAGGDQFGFVRRILPDVTFRGSTTANPSLTLTLYPMKNSGTGFGDSVGGVRTKDVARSASAPVEQFTGQVFVRVRGRQMVLRIESTGQGVMWQSGAHRIDSKPDGARG